MAKTLFDKIWDSHVITDLGNGFVLLHIDRLLLHDLSGARALREVIDKGYTPAQPRLVYATPDHAISTMPGRTDETFPPGAAAAARPAREHREVRHPAVRHRPGRQRHRPYRRPRAGPRRSPARRWSAATVTPARMAAWARSPSASARRSSSMCWRPRPWSSASPSASACSTRARSAEGVTAKDMILHLIGDLGTAAGTGHAVEYAGSAVRAPSAEARLTLCNLSIEMGARTGMVAPDDTTFDYLAGRDYAPKGAMWDRAVAHWRTLPSDPDAEFDREHTIDMAQGGAADHLGHQPRACDRGRSGRSPILRRAGREARGLDGGAAVPGTRARQADRRHQGRLGVHRLLHQQPHLRPARRRRDRQGPPQGAARERLDRAGLGAGQARGRGRRARPLFRTRASNGASPAARCASPPTASACRRGSAASRPPTATSSAARGPARALISPVPRWPRRRRSRAPSPM